MRFLQPNLLLRSKRITSNLFRKYCVSSYKNDEATVYVHWPYCKKICTYCNFNKYINFNVDHDRMKKCLAKETSKLIHIGGVRKIKSIFFGGGTPSLAKVSTLDAVINAINKECVLNDEIELSLEGSPDSLTPAYLRELKAIGINRISIGVQTFSNNELKKLARTHTSEESKETIKAAAKLFPCKTSIDLLFGRPDQTLDVWKNELEMALTFDIDHISLYQLTREKGTQLDKEIKSKNISLPEEDIIADMYEMACEKLFEAGISRYEVSNFARKGSESVHNQAYWEGCQYIGVGPGSHGRFVPRGLGLNEREARVQIPVPELWMTKVEQNGHGTGKVIQQTTHDILCEVLMTGLRTTKGIPNERWMHFSDGISLQTTFGKSSSLKYFIFNGWMVLDEGTLKATNSGIQLLDSLLPSLIAELRIS